MDDLRRLPVRFQLHLDAEGRRQRLAPASPPCGSPTARARSTSTARSTAPRSAPPRTLGAGFTTYIGGDARDATGYFNGLIAGVALYNQALSPAQVQAIYAPASPPVTDQRGLPRPINGTVDIGAYESQGFTPSADPGDGYTIHAGDPVTFSAADSASPLGAGA